MVEMGGGSNVAQEIETLEDFIVTNHEYRIPRSKANLAALENEALDIRPAKKQCKKLKRRPELKESREYKWSFFDGSKENEVSIQSLVSEFPIFAEAMKTFAEAEQRPTADAFIATAAHTLEQPTMKKKISCL
jgi:hypothetical protein